MFNGKCSLLVWPKPKALVVLSWGENLGTSSSCSRSSHCFINENLFVFIKPWTRRVAPLKLFSSWNEGGEIVCTAINAIKLISNLRNSKNINLWTYQYILSNKYGSLFLIKKLKVEQERNFCERTQVGKIIAGMKVDAVWCHTRSPLVFLLCL